MKTMDPSTWSPYNQQPFTHGNTGSPRSIVLPPSTPNDDSLNSYGSANLLMSPCQGLPNLPPRPGTADPTAQPPSMLNSHFESSLLSPPIRTSKDTPDFFGDNLYNGGICKENQSAIPDFIQTTNLPSRNENMGCLPPDSSNNGFHSVPPVSFQPKNIDRPSPGPFGVLPHEAVMARQNRYDRNKDKFVSPISKPVSTPFNSGPFNDQDVNSVYTSTPLSTHSVFSNENASHSPVVNSVTSPNMSNFSSPSDYYSSPKNNFGAYNNVQSPVPQSPSVAQHSYPSSPFTNIDPVSHISTAPPCSPMSGGSYMNKLQDRGVIVSQVPQRNGQKSQHSPGSNSVICFPQQPQGSFHHSHQSAVSKTPDYHSEYGVFSHNHISPTSYPSVYPAIHPTQMPCDDPSMTPRPHASHPSLPLHDNRLQYSHSTSMPASSMGSPTYLQSKVSSAHDMMYGSCSSSLPTGQSMHPTSYEDCPSVIDPLSNHRTMNHHHNPSSLMPSLMSNDRQFTYQTPDLNDDKNALDMFNSHIDSGVHNPDNCQSSISSFLESELPTLETGILASRDLRLTEPTHPPPLNAVNVENVNQEMVPHAQIANFHDNNTELTMKNNISYNYNTNTDICRPGNMTYNSFPRRRGRRGRRRKADIHTRGNYCRYQTYKTDRSSFYNNGFQLDRTKFPEFNSTSCFTNNEYRNNDNFDQYQKSYKDRLDAYEFHTPCYTPSKYQSVRKKDPSRLQNCLGMSQQKPKQFFSVEEELSFLGELKFPFEEAKDSPHTFMKTRNKDCEGFLQCYKNFLEVRRTLPEDEPEPAPPIKEHKHSKEHKERKGTKYQPKLIIKMGRCNNPGEWRLTETVVSPAQFSDSSNDSDSKDSNTNISSHKVSDNESNSLDVKNVEKSKCNSDIVSEKLSKHSAKRIFKYSGHNKNNDHARHHVTNFETLPAGSTLITEKTSVPKKRGRKAKNAGAASIQKKHSTIKTTTDEDPLKKLPHPIKEEIMSDDEVKATTALCSRRSSLRSKREDVVIKKEPEPGPSIKVEPVDLSSDEVDIIDDSDSDPAWTPSCRIPKNSDFSKSHVSNQVVKKQRRKRRSNSSSGAYKLKRKKDNNDQAPKRQGRSVGRKGKCQVPEVKIKQEKKEDLFVVAKADLGNEKRAVWRIDSEMKMLQRFDPYEEQGLQVHRNTFTYAAWNDVTRGQYLQAKVKVLSFSRVLYVVQYLGLEQASNQNPDPSELSTVHPLRENFEVFLQTLISQALDPNFLSEITSENDEYFLSNIKEIEKVTKEKKSLLLKESWNKELQKCAELYPCVNILPCTISEDLKCQICSTSKGEKLVQFYGPPYDSTTLGSTGSPLSNKTQFNVCTICSTTISLYSRLHHQKYNFFVKCRTKMNSVKGDKHLESHVLLEHCLQDSTWVNMLFHELEEVWKECDRVS